MANLKPFNVNYAIPQGLDEDKCFLFDVACLKSTTWEKAPDTLFVMGFVDRGDIANGRLLSASPNKEVFETILEDAEDYYYRVKGKAPRSINYSVVNFNYHRNMHLKGTLLDISLSESRTRLFKLINKLKPKNIVVFGKKATNAILEDENRGAYFGIPQTLNTGKHECNLISCPSFHGCSISLGDDATEEEYDQAIANANHIGYISQCVSTVYDNSLLISKEVTPVYDVVETIEDFDNLIKKMTSRTNKGKPIALDLETNSLFNYELKISTVQIGFTSKKCFLLVLDHKDSPFDEEDLIYIKKKLRKFFAQKNPNSYLIGQNIGYDIRVLRQVLKIPAIYWDVWDIMGAEHALDENIKTLDSALDGENPRKSKNYSLLKIALRYGISWYTSASFSKSQRHLIHELDMCDEVYEYMAMDVLTPIAIHDLQHKRASITPHNGKSYLDTFHNYVRYVLGGCTTHAISTMEQRGIQLSQTMFENLLNPEVSILHKKISEIRDNFYKLPSVKKANRLLLDNMGAPKNGLFADIEEWVFDITKQAHVQLLFIDILGITDYDERKDGGAKVGKDFQSKYRDEYEEVNMFGEFTKHRSIFNSYVKGWYRKLENDNDAILDFRIRPSYSYLLYTGRSNSFSPNLQNVPEHHSSAKFIKTTMRTPKGYIKMDADYSSHEVRVWAIASGDKNLSNTFLTSLGKIYAFRKYQDQKTYLEFKYESDTHKINFSAFTGVPVKEVTKDQRQSAKGIVFGSMYGIGDNALAHSIKKDLKETKEIKGKFFKRFSGGKKYMDNQVQNTIDHQYVTTLLGRRRNLIGHKINVPSLRAAFERRAQNSPIQGVSSDFGYIASRLYTIAIREVMETFKVVSNKEYLTDKGWRKELSAFDKNRAFDPIGVDCMVHDSIKSQVRYDMIFVAIHLKEWAMTTGVREYVKKKLNVDFNVDLGVEIEVGSSGADMYTWSWNTKDLTIEEEKGGEVDEYLVKGLPSLVRDTLQDQKDFGYDINVKQLMKEAKDTFTTMKSHLFENYPLPFHRFKAKGKID